MPERKGWTYEEVEEMYRRFRPASVDGKGRLVLVADKDDGARRQLAIALTRKGFFPLEATDGLEALRQIRDKRPNLCILDIELAPADGIEILDAMRLDPEYRTIPVLLTSPTRDRTPIFYAQRLRAAGYFVKPLKPDDILARVAALLDR